MSISENILYELDFFLQSTFNPFLRQDTYINVGHSFNKTKQGQFVQFVFLIWNEEYLYIEEKSQVI